MFEALGFDWRDAILLVLSILAFVAWSSYGRR